MSHPFGKAPWSLKLTEEDVRRCIAEGRRRGLKAGMGPIIARDVLIPELEYPDEPEGPVEVTPEVEAMLAKIKVKRPPR
ncbi:MAG TPA: hypothetical protein VG753_02320 [Candidatus Paceibacterota bacterium]|nr:hypothetical protein [Candidatus Paceibacterota bacterium]